MRIVTSEDPEEWEDILGDDLKYFYWSHVIEAALAEISEGSTGGTPGSNSLWIAP
jgi:hypothetical protein